MNLEKSGGARAFFEFFLFAAHFILKFSSSNLMNILMTPHSKERTAGVVHANCEKVHLSKQNTVQLTSDYVALRTSLMELPTMLKGNFFFHFYRLITEEN